MGWGEKTNRNSLWYRKRNPIARGAEISSPEIVEIDVLQKIKDFICRILKIQG